MTPEYLQKYLDIDFLRSTGAKPNWFGLGFIQLKLNYSERVHFWHPDLEPIVPDEEIHDHRYDFGSCIVKGELRHQIYTFKPMWGGQQIADPYEMHSVSCDLNVPVPDTPPIVGELQWVGSHNLVEGSSYTFSKDFFHRSTAIEPTVTLLQRRPVEKKFARVLRPLGADTVCPFSQIIPENDLWDYIADTLGQKAIGYHSREIEKGVLGEASKIREETEEFLDAVQQNVGIMALVELSDLMGAIEAYLKQKHPSVTLADLKLMSDVTKRAFENGRRN